MTLVWTERLQGEVLIHATKVPELGTIEIYRDHNGGNAVDINGYRAWSAWRESVDMIKLRVQTRVRGWEYLNTFMEKAK